MKIVAPADRQNVAGQCLIRIDEFINLRSFRGSRLAAFRRPVEKAVRILAVDNEPSVTLSLRYVFPAPKYEITCVESGHQALRQLATEPEPFDVIIVDEKMPNLSGSELVSEMRDRGIHSKIIVVSAHLSSETREAYERMDVHVMFSKPFNVDVLRAAVERVAV